MKNTAFLRVSSLLLALAGCFGVADLALAQTPISACPPPQQNEYLLLVPTPTTDSQQQLRQTLPSNTRSTVCRYQDDTVTRIGGFRRIEDANDWVRYVKDVAGLSAYVVQPTAIAVATSPSNNLPAFNPQSLGDGYAVLVDFLNQPELAAQLRQILGNDVGLVSFGQRPYLLAMYTTNEGRANSTLRQLSDRGFWSMMVDSRRVTLLKPVVSF